MAHFRISVKVQPDNGLNCRTVRWDSVSLEVGPCCSRMSAITSRNGFTSSAKFHVEARCTTKGWQKASLCIKLSCCMVSRHIRSHFPEPCVCVMWQFLQLRPPIQVRPHRECHSQGLPQSCGWPQLPWLYCAQYCQDNKRGFWTLLRRISEASLSIVVQSAPLFVGKVSCMLEQA